MKVNKKKNEIAVIGFACRFPGANDAEQFWENLRHGVNSVSKTPEQRWEIDRYTFSGGNGGFQIVTPYGGFLDGVDLFDHSFFRMKEERARKLDPQARMQLEVVADTVNHAGYGQRELYGSNTGVFIGAGNSHYGTATDFLSEDLKYICTESELIRNRNAFIGNMNNMISSLISNHFNLIGPNMVITTACSSSLVSLHLACQSLMTEESDAAIAGGVQLYCSPYAFIGASNIGVLSPEGKCKTFSKDADGYVLSEGVAAVLLKLLPNALRDRDSIYAVIRSSTVNNDGKTMSMVMPNMHAQKRVVLQALQQAELDASIISYMEANGTALPVGDPLELKALTQAFRTYTKLNGYCAIGSVETNIGHATHAAGMASLLKVVLSLMHREIPPTLNCEIPSPKIDFPNTPFYPNTTLSHWEPISRERYAGINCFGFGGTNTHVILQEFQPEKYAGYDPLRNPLKPLVYERQRLWFNDEAYSENDQILEQ